MANTGRTGNLTKILTAVALASCVSLSGCRKDNQSDSNQDLRKRIEQIKKENPNEDYSSEKDLININKYLGIYYPGQ